MKNTLATASLIKAVRAGDAWRATSWKPGRRNTFLTGGRPVVILGARLKRLDRLGAGIPDRGRTIGLVGTRGFRIVFHGPELEAAQIFFFYLPSYSPELSNIEPIWNAENGVVLNDFANLEELCTALNNKQV